MEDPNLGILIDWIRTRYPNSLHRHYRLCLDKDVCALQTNRSPNDRVYPIVYGNKYSQLTQFNICFIGLYRATRLNPNGRCV